jgi:hypothetical protein
MQKIFRLANFPAEAADFIKSFYSQSHLRALLARENGYETFNTLIPRFPGHWLILTDVEFTGQGTAPFILAWVAPWAIECAARCDYYQLDGSFKIAHPSVYSVPTAIEKNESFPLGFCIAPTECVELYSTFFDFLIKLGANPDHIFGKPLLSDRHKALMAYGEKFVLHFWMNAVRQFPMASAADRPCGARQPGEP